MSFLTNRVGSSHPRNSRALKSSNLGRRTAFALALLVALSNLMPATASDSAPELLQDINAGSGGSRPEPLTIFDNKLIFKAYTPATGNELFSYDGSNITALEVNPGSGNGFCCNTPTELNGKLYFMGETAATGQELFVYDGTSVSLVADINPGSGDSTPQEFTVLSNKLYFRASNPATGTELYSYDGVSASLVEDLRLGSASSYPEDLTTLGDKLFFKGYSNSNGYELFSFDGTSMTLIDINPGSGHSSPNNLTVFNNKLYFTAYQPATNYELFMYDGSSVSLVADINPGGVSSSVMLLTEVNGKLYFRGYNPTTGDELYVHDGTSTSVVDINPGSTGSSPNNLTPFNNKLYFTANDGTNGAELYVYDGTGSAALVQDIRTGSSGIYSTQFVVFEDRLYFDADDGSNGSQLWIYDGISATRFDINPTGDAWDMMMASPNFKSTSLGLFFSADDGTTGAELWRVESVAGQVATSSVIYNDDAGATIVLTGSGFKANDVLSLSEFTIDTTGTGLTASSVSVNAGATAATIVFTGTALTGKVSITANDSAFAASPGSPSNTLDISISSRILPACPVSAAITEPCLDSGTVSRTGSVGFRLSYSNNSGFEGASFSIQAEIETSSNVFAPVADGDVATDLVILYPTSSNVGGRLKTATWAMATHKDFVYTKEIVTVNTTEVVKLTTSYEYINFASKAGCGVGSMAFGAAPQAACESVGVSGDYVTSADRSIDFLAATDLSWLVAETGADGGYLNYLGSSFMWGSTADTPLRFQLVGPHLKSANVNDLNSGSFQVYLPAALVTYVYGANFNPNTDLSLTRQDEGVITATLSGTADVILTQPNGGDLLIDVPTHPFSAPVFTVSSTPSATSAPYTGPLLNTYSDRNPSIGNEVVVSGQGLNLITSCTIDGVTAVMSNQSADSFTITIPAGLRPGPKDLVITSSAGTLTVQDALTISAAAEDSSESVSAVSAKGWTKKLNDSSAKIYTKDLVGAGKVQFFVNGKEIAWVNATSADDPKLRTANGAYYLVRTVYLVEGQKNVLEIWVEGVRAWRSAYSY